MIWKRRWWRIFSVVLALGAVACWFVPLVKSAGAELSLVFALPASILGACVGISSARATAGHPLVVFARAVPFAVLPLIPPILIAMLPGAIGWGTGRLCEPSLSLQFWAWTPIASAAFSCALGVTLARCTRWAGLLFAAIVIASVVRLALDLLDGPEMFNGSHFLGWLEGGIYEEVVSLDPALKYLRLLSALIALVLLLATSLLVPEGSDRDVRLPAAPSWEAAALAMALFAFAIAHGYRKELRLDLTREDVRRALGGHLQTEHFDIWYQKGSMDETKLALVANDHEYRLARVTKFLGVAPRDRISSYVFPNNEAKRRLTGSADTQVANIDHLEIYVTDYGYPHPVIEHELAHIVSGEFAGPFGVAWNGLMPNVAFVEGIAVATSFHDKGRGNPHEESAAMMKEKLLPSMEAIAGLGFWADRQARAYTATGSFLRFLVETHGIEKVRAAYAWTSVEKAFGKDLGALEVEWRRFLETVPVPEKRRAAAQERFTQPSLFEQTCARELARLEKDAWAALPKDALPIVERWKRIDDRTAPLRAASAKKRELGDLAGALDAARARVSKEIPDSPGAWWARSEVGDLLYLQGDRAAAEKEWRGVLGAAATPDLVRNAWFRVRGIELLASARPSERALGNGVLDYLVPPPKRRASIVPLVTIATAATLDGTPHAVLAAYLIGRALMHDPANALPWLDAAARGLDALGPVEVRAETLALRADALTRLGRLEEASEGWRKLAAMEGTPGEVGDLAEDGMSRVEFLRNAAKASLDERSLGP